MKYETYGFKTMVSNDYDSILEAIIEYFRLVRIKCLFCSRKFVSPNTLKKHVKFFHKIYKD